MTESREMRTGRKKAEQFLGQPQEFGDKGLCARRARKIGHLLRSALLFGLVLVLLVACGGGTGGTGGGATGGDTGSSGSSGTGGGTTMQRGSSGEPISEGCQPPDMENCYGYGEMQAYADQIVPMIEQFFDTTYADMPHPAGYIYVSEGETGQSGCIGGYSDQDYAYCPADEKIYLGQRSLWSYYQLGDAAPAVGLAHEWGHHVQKVVEVPPAQTDVGQISRENQADCIAGAWIGHADKQEWLDYPDDLEDTDALLADIASDEPGRAHGDLGERTDSLLLGLEEGLQGCNDFFPSTPVFIAEGTTPSASPDASSTVSASASSSASTTASPSASSSASPSP